MAGVASVTYYGETLIDITDSTVTAGKLAQGEIAYGADGGRIVGTMTSGGGGAPSTITAGNTPVLSSSELAFTTTSTTMTATGISITIAKAGTYRFKFSAARTSTSGTWTAQLYRNGSPIIGATATWSSYHGTYSGDIACSAGDVIQIYACSRSSIYKTTVGQLVACINWDNGF